MSLAVLSLDHDAETPIIFLFLYSLGLKTNLSNPTFKYSTNYTQSERWRSSVMCATKKWPPSSAPQMKPLSAMLVIAPSTIPTSSQKNTNASLFTTPFPPKTLLFVISVMYVLTPFLFSYLWLCYGTKTSPTFLRNRSKP